jgi:hypothetical protein
MATLSQRLIWTAVPAGLSADGRSLRVNLLVSMRLSVSGSAMALLSEFGAIARWADTVNDASISIVLDGQPRDAIRLAPASMADWSAMLPGTTPIRGHRFDDFRKKRVLSYPLAELAEMIEADYAALASQAEDDLPDLGRLKRQIDYAPSREAPGEHAKWLQELLSRLEADENEMDRQQAIDLLAAYHRPLEAEEIIVQDKALLPDGTPDPDDPHEKTLFRTHRRVPLPDPAEWRNELDFHRIVSALGQHPELMRRIGLVIPLEIPRAGVGNGTHILWVKPEWAGGDVTTDPDVLPVTHALLGQGRFLPAPRGSMLRRGWLRVRHPSYRLVVMDVDGGGMLLKNFSRSEMPSFDERQDDDRPRDPPRERGGAPRLRTAGLQLAHRRRHRAVRAMFQESGDLNDLLETPGGNLNLYAEDLLRGWRVDVKAQGGKWQSLMRFNGTYGLLNDGRSIETSDEEAIVRIAGAESADGANPDVMKISEAVFAWSGWSLAAPEPGRAIMPDDETHAEGPNDTPPGLPLHASFKARRGSLPTLRFGRTYQVRLRAADVTGGGLPWSEGKAGVGEVESEPVFFGRLEPVEAPPLTLVADDPLPADGESLGRAAMRLMDEQDTTTTSVRRLVVPPRVGQRFAEAHGVLDRDDGRPDPSRYGLLVGRDAATKEVIVETRAWNPDGAPGGGAIIETPYPVHPEGAPTPWLDDPLAAGLAVRVFGLPDIDPATVHRLSFVSDEWDPDHWPEDWPSARPIVIRAAADAGDVSWDRASRTLVIPLGKAERARLRISALVPKRGWEMMRLIERVRAMPDGADRWKNIRARLFAGQHWMFTPWRVLELVHATQRPLIEPDLEHLGASRPLDDPTARIGFSTPIHAKSTLKLDVKGEWLEIDDSRPEGPTTRRLEAAAFTIPFHRLDHPDLVARRQQGRHVFADTRARRVFYTPTATTRFREYMPPDIRADAANLTRSGPARRVWVPASSPPPPPIIRHIVPTFGWRTTSSAGGAKTVWRNGGGLRVYLERPWFASGANEMLAVLLPRGQADPQASAARAFVTQWGADPLWPGGKVNTVAPRRQDFPLRVESEPVPTLFTSVAPQGETPPDPVPEGEDAGSNFWLTQLQAPGMPAGLEVDAVPHAVGFNPDLGLWYADIVVQPGAAYFPFIRLALARYQPNAMGNCHLSSVVMASFQQLAPDRMATVTPLRGRQVRLEIRGRLPTHIGAASTVGYGPRAGIFSVALQRLQEGANPDFDWETVSPPAAPARETSQPRLPRPQVRAATLRNARIQLERGLFTDLLRQPGVIEALMPPLIHGQEIRLPPRGNYSWRLLVTESELWSADATGREDGLTAPSRIVYAVALDL